MCVCVCVCTFVCERVVDLLLYYAHHYIALIHWPSLCVSIVPFLSLQHELVFAVSLPTPLGIMGIQTEILDCYGLWRRRKYECVRAFIICVEGGGDLI